MTVRLGFVRILILCFCGAFQNNCYCYCLLRYLRDFQIRKMLAQFSNKSRPEEFSDGNNDLKIDNLSLVLATALSSITTPTQIFTRLKLFLSAMFLKKIR